MNKRRKQVFWQQNYWILILAVLVLTAWIVRCPELWDFWKGVAYTPTTEALEIRDALELTNKGRRIFNATQLSVEDRESFNEHCQSYDEEISLLGCYTDGKIYIYEITEPQLVTANKVTAAHELLHAAWERMGGGEQRRLLSLLEAVYQDNREWFDEELAAYSEDERTEEIYTRAATKLVTVPEELERHYAGYFRNRGQIVAYYQQYEAPFVLLRTELEQLETQIEQISAEIGQERTDYTKSAENLDTEIDRFNSCAETAGCFQSQAEFQRQRNALMAERTRLERLRETLNQKILENNQRIEEYQEKQRSLGYLSDLMNSNVQEYEIIK